MFFLRLILYCFLLCSFLVPSLINASELTLTQKEKKFVNSHRIIRVANETDWPPFDYVEFGKPKGFAIDFFRLLAQKANLQIEFINGFTWDELIQKFKNKKLDILPVFYRNPEREGYALFTQPYYKGKLGVFSQQPNKTTFNNRDILGKRIGIQKGHGAIPFILEKFPGITLDEYPNTDTLVKNLGIGRLDAIIGNPLLFCHLAKENQVTNIQLSDYIELDDLTQKKISFHIGVRKDYTVLHGILSKTIASVSEDELRNIESKWNYFAQNASLPAVKVKLSPEEQVYISSHPVLRASNEIDYPPFDFAIAEQPRGYSIDMLNLIAERTGLRIKYVNGYSLYELLSLFKQGKLDLVHSINKTPSRKKIGLFSKPFHRYRNHFFTRKGLSEIKGIRDLTDKVLAVTKGWSSEEYIRRHHPEIILKVFRTFEETIEAVSEHKADVLFSGETVTYFMIKKMSINNLKKSDWFKEFDQGESQKLHFMVQNDSPELVSILNKGLATITPGDIERLERKWFGNKTDTSAPPVRVALSIKEQAFIENHPQIILGTTPSFAPHAIQNSDGSVDGVDVDYANLIRERTGLNISFELGNWHKQVEKAQKRKTDGLSTTVVHPERVKLFDFSDPYFKLQSTVFVKKGNPKQIYTENDFSQKRIVIQKGNKRTQKIAQAYPGVEIIYVESSIEIIKAIISDKADFTVWNETLLYNARKEGLNYLDIAFTIGEPFYLVFSLRNDWPELKTIIDKALKTITERERLEIRDRWYGNRNLDGKEPNNFKLLKEEQAYLAQKGHLKMCVRPNWFPYERINKEGYYEGLGSDIIRLIEKKISTPIELLPTNDWDESLFNLKAGVCDILPIAIKSPIQQDKIVFSSPYTTTPLVIATLATELFIKDAKDIGNRKIGIIKGSAFTELLRKNHPEMQIVDVENSEDGLMRVRKGELFGYVDTMFTIGYTIQTNTMFDLKIAGRLEYDLDLSIASHTNEPMLASIIQKAVESITEQERSLIRNKWLSIKFEKGFNYKLLWKILAGCLLVVLVLIYRNIIVSKYNKKLDALYKTDKLTGISNRHLIDEEIEREVSRASRYDYSFSVILIDIDYFKKINDLYGHHIGDSVLVEFAQILKNNIRETDSAGRWGGEEFIVICPETEINQAVAVAEKLRNCIELYSFSDVNEAVTSSFGVTTYKLKDTAESIVKRVDSALYVSKKDGRNCVSKEN